ncbi:Alginate lyase [Parasponia andersonii]|uniref:Alginate lyase n=1 Tax=Parasponia andersonii TaxID=3476 RepID=A0A2P5B3Z0_PARAD|nr:Alginate lyase [Parasponia andersonii]
MVVISTKCYNLLISFAFVGLILLENIVVLNGAIADLTYGFVAVPLTESNFEIQKPYDVPLEQRHSFENGVRRLWVYADDKPHNPSSRTQPRTEVRIKGLDYTSGVWQFEGYGFVPNGTSGATVAQIHGASHGATTIILRIYNGDMKYYNRDLVAKNLYDKWFRLNIIHDVDRGNVAVFIDGIKKFQGKDKGPGDLYFKCGVYAAPANISYYMESRWKDIKIYKKY